MRALKATRVAVVMGTMAASLLIAGGAQASTAGDKDDRYEGKSSGSYEEYEEREEYYSEGRSEKKMRDYWEERDRDHWHPEWHYANPRKGDFDFHHGDDRRHGHDHHRHYGKVRAGDGGDG